MGLYRLQPLKPLFYYPRVNTISDKSKRQVNNTCVHILFWIALTYGRGKKNCDAVGLRALW
jgi:hypothetical protein